MSSEIVVVGDESCETQYVDISKASNVVRCRPQGSCSMEEDIRAFDMLKLRKTWNPSSKTNLTGGDYHTMKFLKSESGHIYLTKSDPDLAYVKDVVEKINVPSVLLIRGCDLFLQANFPLEKFKTLMNLEISGCCNVTTLPENTISELTQLQSLNLSHLPIKQLPDDFFSKLTKLKTLILKGCSNMHSLPKFPLLNQLEYLQLSHLPIETLPEGFSNLGYLTYVSLRGCSKLSFLPSIEEMIYLKYLDLSHCTTLQEIETFQSFSSILKTLDLSYTAMSRIPMFHSQDKNLTDLFLRDLDMGAFDPLPYHLEVLDLSGAKNVRLYDLLCYTRSLLSLDLSRTEIESVYMISNLTELRHLILKECSCLVELHGIRWLTKLEVLDISGCGNLDHLPEDLRELANLKEFNLSRCSGLTELREGIFDQMSSLEKLDLSKTQLTCLPSFANLFSLRTLVLSQNFLNKVPDVSDRVEIVDVAPSGSPKCLEGSISKPNEFHLVSTFIGYSAFDKFRFQFTELNGLISKIQLMNLKPSVATNALTTHMKRQLESIPADLKYIKEKMDLLEISPKCTTIETLLDDIICFEIRNYFPLDSTKLTELIQMVTKLKLLVPREPMDDLEKIKKEEEDKSKRNINKPNMNRNKREFVEEIDKNKPEMQTLLRCYRSLTNIQRKCLLYFAFIPFLRHFYIHENFFIALWYGEGFIDPEHEENVDLETGSSGSKPNSIQEIGQQIFNVLEEKGFLRGERYSRHKKYYMVTSSVCPFVVTQAKEERFFDIECKEGWGGKKFNTLTPHFTGSKRACVLLSSCAVWMNYANTPKKLQCFKNIRTLLNLEDPVIDIKTEWFSKMKNLSVLVLGNFRKSEINRDVVDLKFLEELKSMKQLRLLSLLGITAITRLPDSVCELTNLRILNLSYCSNLEELPDGIGSLKNLTHLDLTHCHILSKLPEELKLLSKLEVLKGFVINYEAGGRQHLNACTLSHLLKLKNLMKFSLIVNRDNFPSNEDLQVFTEMRRLCNLKITWQKSYSMNQEEKTVIGHGALNHSRWKMLKCWEPKTCQNDTEEPLGSYQFDNLEKLVLCCFPSETAPKWLDPSGMQNLEKLYIVGGNLKTLSRGTNQHTWNVKTLLLRYLPNLEMDWDELRTIFSSMTYCRKNMDGCIRDFPPNMFDEWSISAEEQRRNKKNLKETQTVFHEQDV